MKLKEINKDINKENGCEDSICDLREELIDKFKLRLSLEISLIELEKDELINIINEIYK